MSTLLEVLSRAGTICTTSPHIKVEQTVADELMSSVSTHAHIEQAHGLSAPAGTVRIAVVQDQSQWKTIHKALDGKEDWMLARLRPGEGIELLTSRPHLLYQLFTFAV
ncbi:MAG: hypothetical protein KGJ59_00965, partial [Bacteroidota bacterium]|nr:hypothetical protein [Bacteroidota bacterium]